MAKPSAVYTVLCLLAFQASAGCSDKSAEQAQAPLPPALGVLELPVSLRSGDGAPNDARNVDVNMSEVRVDDKIVLKLDNGKVPAAEQKDGVLPKLKAALQSPPKGRIALAAHASLPYETAALVLSSASAAGMHQLSFKVRKPGGSTDTGWLSVTAFQMAPRTYDEVAMPSVDPHKWDDFAKAWQAMHDACRSSQTGSCPYVENNVATGGDLKIRAVRVGRRRESELLPRGAEPRAARGRGAEAQGHARGPQGGRPAGAQEKERCRAGAG